MRADDLQKSQRALQRAQERAEAEFWSQSAKKKVEECRRAVGRAQRRLEEVGQMTLPLGEEMHAPDGFR